MVPKAAPITPNPAPGIVIPRMVRVGKISRKLKMTSRMHVRMLRTLGMCMLPLHRSIPLHKEFRMENGIHST